MEIRNRVFSYWCVCVSKTGECQRRENPAELFDLWKGNINRERFCSHHIKVNPGSCFTIALTCLFHDLLFRWNGSNFLFKKTAEIQSYRKFWR